MGGVRHGGCAGNRDDQHPFTVKMQEKGTHKVTISRRYIGTYMMYMPEKGGARGGHDVDASNPQVGHKQEKGSVVSKSHAV